MCFSGVENSAPAVRAQRQAFLLLLRFTTSGILGLCYMNFVTGDPESSVVDILLVLQEVDQRYSSC